MLSAIIFFYLIDHEHIGMVCDRFSVNLRRNEGMGLDSSFISGKAQKVAALVRDGCCGGYCAAVKVSVSNLRLNSNL